MKTTEWTRDKVLATISEARRVGRIEADKKLAELQDRGPTWTVKEAGRSVGTMLDVCGMASLKIRARGKFYILAKKLASSSAVRFYCSRAYGGGGNLSIFDSTMRQEISVNIAACQGQARVLASFGIEATITSRTD